MHLGTLIGTPQALLIEKNGAGRTECFAPAIFAGDAQPGAIVFARITGVHADCLMAEAA